MNFSQAFDTENQAILLDNYVTSLDSLLLSLKFLKCKQQNSNCIGIADIDMSLGKSVSCAVPLTTIYVSSDKLDFDSCIKSLILVLRDINMDYSDIAIECS